jgi:hypothetical protein
MYVFLHRTFIQGVNLTRREQVDLCHLGQRLHQ